MSLIYQNVYIIIIYIYIYIYFFFFLDITYAFSIFIFILRYIILRIYNYLKYITKIYKCLA